MFVRDAITYSENASHLKAISIDGLATHGTSTCPRRLRIKHSQRFPDMPLVSIVSPLDAQSSYGLHTIQLARRLPRYGIDVILRPSRATGELPDDIKVLVKHGENNADVELMLHPPTISCAKRNTLYYSMCESTQLTHDAVRLLNMATVVAVPSDWCATVFSACGVTRPIVTVPLGCDEAFQPMPKMEGQPFTFACAGNIANGPTRKGISKVVALFGKAFPNQEDVRLKVKVHVATESADDRITFHHEFLNEPSLACWLSSADCFVNLATGGFELWPLQAMRCGVPVIGFTFGGMGQYLNAENGFVVDHRLVPAVDGWKGQGMWAEADEEAVIAAMRYAATARNFCHYLGEKAMQSVKDFTFGRHAERLAQLLKSMLPKKKPHITQAPSRARKDLITVVFPVCEKDIDLAVAHAQWLATLPNRTEHVAILATDSSVSTIQVDNLATELRKYFQQVTVYTFAPPPVTGWPQAANWAFQQVALYMARWTHPWLWMEPDAVALSDDWLEKLQAEYDQYGKPFMGAVVKQMGHMNGCGIYPPDTPARAPHAMSCTETAFDFVMKEDTKDAVHDTPLIQHIWSVKGETVSENQDGPAPKDITEERARRWLTRDAVVVHRVKDSSLVNLLKAGHRRTRVEVVITNWRRPGNIPLVRDSIRNQTERVWITLIDASETPGNACVTDGFDRVFKMPNLGSWNRMVMAGGYDCEYTLFIDDDVLAGPTMVETFLKFADQVQNNFGVIGFKGRDYVDGNLVIVDDPKQGAQVCAWLARLYFIKTRDLHFGLGERHRIGSRIRLPSIHIDAVMCMGITRATGQPCYVMPSVPGMEWDALPANDAVWQKESYRASLLKTLEKLKA